jgi:hypothetical protein
LGILGGESGQTSSRGVVGVATYRSAALGQTNGHDQPTNDERPISLSLHKLPRLIGEQSPRLIGGECRGVRFIPDQRAGCGETGGRRRIEW